MLDTTPILSVIVISHNQREELRRCIDSILVMQLSYPYEIIISDDRSTDGTYELAKEYERTCLQKNITTYDKNNAKPNNLIRITALQCNSDECHPANNSQRSGYNRCNAYPHAQGKYIAHVDADDYFLPHSTVYEKQIKALEAHPECALAMSNCLCVRDGEPTENGKPWRWPRKMTNGEIISGKEFIKTDFFRINQCFMQRRNPDADPVALYGKRYVDSVITYHHLQFGKVVFADACDYVYVGHIASVTGQMAKANHDATVIWCLAIYIPALIPRWKKEFLSSAYYDDLRRAVALAMSGYRLQPNNINGLADLDVFVYKCFAKQQLTETERLRLHLAEKLMQAGKRLRIDTILPQVLFKLLIR